MERVISELGCKKLLNVCQVGMRRVISGYVGFYMQFGNLVREN